MTIIDCIGLGFLGLKKRGRTACLIDSKRGLITDEFRDRLSLRPFEGQTLLKALLELIEHYGEDNDQTGNDLFPELLDA